MAKQNKKETEDLLKALQELNDAEQNSLSNNLKINDAKRRANDAMRDLVSFEKEINKSLGDGNNLSKEEIKSYEKQIELAKKELAKQREILGVENKRLSVLGFMYNKLNQIGSSNFFGFLMDSDKAVKSLNLELGLSGEKSAQMRQSIEGAAVNAARLGASVQDLANIQSTFADETGRARIQSEAALDAIVAIGKGTGLGIEQAARLTGQFELMGLSTEQSANYVQGVVDTTERMGVNTTKVLKNITTNFKDLQKFTFRGGVQGFAEMASYAEKFKIDMGSMLDSTEKARTLEGAVDLAAQLQVMGGEFAKSDPFQLLFLSRNDPAKFTQKINEMTKGVATFKKNAEGGFETFISPMDMDRLERVGQALGMQRGELAEQSRRMLEISKMKQQMIGLDKKQMEIASGLAKREGDSLQYYVEIAGKKKMLNQLSETDISNLEKQSKALEARAKSAKTFDEEFVNTVQMFKSSMLPILQGINSILDNQIRPLIETIQGVLNGKSEAMKSFLIGAGKALAIGVALTKSVGLVTSMYNKIGIGKMGGLMGKKGGGAGSAVGKAAKSGGGLSALGTGAGVGIAAAGVGAGVMLASKGIAQLAESMSKLDETQIWALPATMLAMSVGAFALAPAITAVGAAGTAGSLGLLALGAAAVGVGFGINLAATGIGAMAESFATLDGVDLSGIAGGILSIGGAALMIGNPMGIAGMIGITSAVSSIGSNADNLERVGNAFYNINSVLQGSASQFKEIRATIDAINSMESGGESAFASLASILNKPLKVEFADNNATFNATVNLNVDGKKIADSINISRRTAIKTADEKSGKSGSGSV
jgi:hypothetical protein